MATINSDKALRDATPSLGLKLTSPSALTGSFGASVTSWGGAEGGTFTFQLINPNGYVEDVKQISTSSLSSGAVYFSNQKDRNAAYKIRVSATNGSIVEYKTSGTYYSAPPSPYTYIESIFYDKTTNSAVITVGWAKPADGGGRNLYFSAETDFTSSPAPANTEKKAQVFNVQGAAQSGTVSITGLAPGYDVNFLTFIQVNGSAIYGYDINAQPIALPSAPLTFEKLEWNDTRDTLSVTVGNMTSTYASIYARYSPDISYKSRVLTKTSNSNPTATWTLSGLEHGNGEKLYLKAWTRDYNNIRPVNESFVATTIPIPNPILGLAKTCESSKKIIDIRENEGTSLSSPWITGPRVVKTAPCLPPPSGTGQLGIYDVQVKASQKSSETSVSPLAAWTIKFKLTPDTDLTKLYYANLNSSQIKVWLGDGSTEWTTSNTKGYTNMVHITYNPSNREVIITHSTLPNTTSNPYQMHTYIIYKESTALSYVVDAGYFPNSNGIFYGNGNTNFGTYSLNDGELALYTGAEAYISATCFKDGLYIPRRVLSAGKNSCPS